MLRRFAARPSVLVVSRLLELVLGCIFVVAGMNKLIRPHELVTAMYGYELIGPPWVLVIAIVLPGLELALGCAMLIGRMSIAALSLTGVLCIVFVLVQISALWRNLEIECGCGFNKEVSAHSVLVASSLAAIAIGVAGVFFLGRAPERPDTARSAALEDMSSQ